MNFRSLTRGDAVVIGAAVLLFIASFLNTTSGDSGLSITPWEFLGNAIGMYMVGIIGAALIVVHRAMPQPRKIAGLELNQVGIAFTVAVAWQFFWTILDASGAGPAIILGLIASLALAGGAVATPLVPALSADLMGAPKPQPMYGGQPQQGGYGYPGAQQGQQGQQPYPGQQQPSYGGQPVPGQQAAPQDQGAQAAQAQAPAAGGDFAPFWFAVPVQRPLYAEDGNPTPIAELAPGTWYLAVEQRGPGLVAQTQDGRRGVLQDTTGIQRG
ncbi:hypothetical protein QIS99_26210 [Streptomyces sp. B-S-A8]|uniref:Integral membrane protein n=1 Tax=Streptomyces solicavernae TaxID=3043614 RepID=A0ABT6RZ99_9ACTN|nr:hypothetical protein [Streptomyces sp. B-S-A8]MDI3389655.1 hypothetical protein [Streptomyces sp. B-S-A8]